MSDAGPDAVPAEPPPVVSLAQAREPAAPKPRRPRRLGFRDVAVPGREVQADSIASDLHEVSSGLSVLAEWLYQRRETQASDAVFVLRRSLDRSVEEPRAQLSQDDVD